MQYPGFPGATLIHLTKLLEEYLGIAQVYLSSYAERANVTLASVGKTVISLGLRMIVAKSL